MRTFSESWSTTSLRVTSCQNTPKDPKRRNSNRSGGKKKANRSGRAGGAAKGERAERHGSAAGRSRELQGADNSRGQEVMFYSSLISKLKCITQLLVSYSFSVWINKFRVVTPTFKNLILPTMDHLNITYLCTLHFYKYLFS